MHPTKTKSVAIMRRRLAEAREGATPEQQRQLDGMERALQHLAAAQAALLVAEDGRVESPDPDDIEELARLLVPPGEA